MRPSETPLFIEAQRHQQQGRPEQAAPLYERLLEQQPHHAGALHFLALIRSQQGEHVAAQELMARALTAMPSDWMLQHNHGEVLRRAGMHEAALPSFRHAVELAPQSATAHFGLGNALRKLGRDEEALPHFEAAARLGPAQAQAHYNLANTLFALGRFRSSLAAYREALRLRPGDALIHNNFGNALRECGDDAASMAEYRRALELAPDSIDALRNLASRCEAEGLHDEALPLRRRVFASEPDDLMALGLEAHCPVIAPSNEFIDEYRERLHGTLDRWLERGLRLDPAQLTRAGGEPQFHLGYHGRDDRPLREKYGRLFDKAWKDLPRIEHPLRRGKPHVGIVVTHGHEGVFLKCMRGVIRTLPLDRFRLSIVCNYESGAALLRTAIARDGVEFVALPGDFSKAVDRLRGAQFDLLYYWELGTDPTNYFLPYARPAPVQCSGWGWPVTSGIPHVDWFISCGLLEPDNGDAHYSERVARLPTLPTHYFRPPVPDRAALMPRAQLGFGDDQHVYLELQNPRKVHPDMDPLFGRILREDPKAVLVVIGSPTAGINAQLTARLQRSMPDVFDRVRLLKMLPEREYFSLVSHADVVLDTPHYSGGANTTCDVFAAGTPVVTMPTAFHRGRYTAAAYRYIGVTDCIAGSADEYVNIALRLGADGARREHLGRRIAEASAPLYESPSAAPELADFFDSAITRQRSS